MIAARIAVLAAALFVTPFAHAQTRAPACNAPMLRGWSPATETHGTAVEHLFARGAQPTLSLSRLPANTDVESGLMLIPALGGESWTLRYAEANERVQVWKGGQLRIRVDEAPELREVPMPSGLARRLMADWQSALLTATEANSVTALPEGETLLFVIGDLRVSAAVPECGVGALLMQQADLLSEASDDSESRRERRWRELGESLAALETVLAKQAESVAAGVAP